MVYTYTFFFYCCWVSLCIVWFLLFFFFKQKTAYEMRISDWSSDVCSSDLPGRLEPAHLRIGDIHVEMDRGSEILSDPLDRRHEKIGRASCRERVCQYV